MYALLRHKTTHEVSALLHRQRWSSTRQNIAFEITEVTIYATLDTRRKMAYSSQAKIVACGYHVYKNLAWSNAKQRDFVTVEIETDKESKKTDSYCNAIKVMVDMPPRLKTVGHVPREILRYIFFFLKEENRKVGGFVYSTRYQPSLIPAGGLETPPKLTFKSPNFITHQKMKDFMTNLYSYDCESKAETDEDDDAEIHFIIAKEGLDGEVVKPKVKRKLPKLVNHQNQIVRTVKWLNQQLRGSLQKG